MRGYTVSLCCLGFPLANFVHALVRHVQSEQTDHKLHNVFLICFDFFSGIPAAYLGST